MNTRHARSARAIACLVTGLPADEARPAAAPAKFAYGLMLQSGDRVIFSPCRDNSYTTMEDVSADRSLTKALNTVGLAAGKKLYVELMAVAEGNVLRASALNMARAEGRCQLPGTADEDWRAAGNEPGWILAAGGERVILKRHDKPDVSAAYVPFKAEGKASVFTSEQLSVRLENTACRDTMADAVFGWTATVLAEGQTLRGCAWQR